MIYMSVVQVLFDLDLIFMVHCSVLNFCVLVCFSHTLCNRSTIFLVWNGCKVYMSSGQMSSDLDLIFMFQWSKFLSIYLILYAIGQLYLVYGNIL